MTHSESLFNTNLIFPCLLATVSLLNSTTNFTAVFVPGEEPLKAMTSQLNHGKSKAVDNRKTYHADAVVRAGDFSGLEILLLETSGRYRNKDERKISFDNTKGMFALLAMIKTVADMFNFAFVDTFKKLKIYFVQASGTNARAT